MQFKYSDLILYRDAFGCYNLCGDTPLADFMADKAREYSNWDEVRFHYCVGRRDPYEDPRVAKELAQHFETANLMLRHHQQKAALIEEKKQMRLQYGDGDSDSDDEDIRNAPKTVKPITLQPFNMELFDMNHERMSQLLTRLDFETAALGLAFFNSKFNNSDPYILVEVYAHHHIVKEAKFWKHSNFKARPRNGGPSRIFFVEVYDSRVVTFCCILDGILRTRGCDFCPSTVVHPQDGGFLGGHLPPQSDLLESSSSSDQAIRHLPPRSDLLDSSSDQAVLLGE